MSRLKGSSRIASAAVTTSGALFVAIAGGLTVTWMLAEPDASCPLFPQNSGNASTVTALSAAALPVGVIGGVLANRSGYTTVPLVAAWLSTAWQEPFLNTTSHRFLYSNNLPTVGAWQGGVPGVFDGAAPACGVPVVLVLAVFGVVCPALSFLGGIAIDASRSLRFAPNLGVAWLAIFPLSLAGEAVWARAGLTQWRPTPEQFALWPSSPYAVPFGSAALGALALALVSVVWARLRYHAPGWRRLLGHVAAANIAFMAAYIAPMNVA